MRPISVALTVLVSSVLMGACAASDTADLGAPVVSDIPGDLAMTAAGDDGAALVDDAPGLDEAERPDQTGDGTASERDETGIDAADDADSDATEIADGATGDGGPAPSGSGGSLTVGDRLCIASSALVADDAGPDTVATAVAVLHEELDGDLAVVIDTLGRAVLGDLEAAASLYIDADKIGAALRLDAATFERCEVPVFAATVGPASGGGADAGECFSARELNDSAKVAAGLGVDDPAYEYARADCG